MMVGETMDLRALVELSDTALAVNSSFPWNKEDGALILLERIIGNPRGYVLSRKTYENGNVKDYKKYTFGSYRDPAFAVVPFSNIPLSAGGNMFDGVLLLYEHQSSEEYVHGPVVTSAVLDENLDLLHDKVITRFSEESRVSDIRASLVKNSVTDRFAVRVHITYQNGDEKMKKNNITQSFPELDGLGFGKYTGVWEPLEEVYRVINSTDTFGRPLCALWMPYNGK